jgi:hypothetical protein
MTVLAPDHEDQRAREALTDQNGGSGRRPPAGNGQGGNGQDGDGAGPAEPNSEVPARFLRRRRSIWPFLLDLGVVLALFGLIITGRFLIVIGAVVFVVALIGWMREARAEYAALRE